MSEGRISLQNSHGSEEGAGKKRKTRSIIFLPFPGYFLLGTLAPDALLFAEQHVEDRRVNQWTEPALPSDNLELNLHPAAELSSNVSELQFPEVQQAPQDRPCLFVCGEN